MISSSFTHEITHLHAEICSALSDARRILILYTLSGTPLNVSDVANQVNISQPSASRHLTILRERGMVAAQRDGQFVVYKIADERIIQALDLLRSVLASNLRNKALLVNNVLET